MSLNPSAKAWAPPAPAAAAAPTAAPVTAASAIAASMLMEPLLEVPPAPVKPEREVDLAQMTAEQKADYVPKLKAFMAAVEARNAILKQNEEIAARNAQRTAAAKESSEAQVQALRTQEAAAVSKHVKMEVLWQGGDGDDDYMDMRDMFDADDMILAGIVCPEDAIDAVDADEADPEAAEMRRFELELERKAQEEEDARALAEAASKLGKNVELRPLNQDDLFLHAKRGEAEEFIGLETEMTARMGFQLNAGLADTYSRNLLHFAAEGGSEALVRNLLQRGCFNAAAKETVFGLAPWEVALLCEQYPAAAVLAPAGAATDAAAREALLAAKAPKKAEIKLAFGAAPPKFPDTHAVWGKSAATAAAPPAGIVVSSVEGAAIDWAAEARIGDAIRTNFNRTAQAGGVGVAAWAKPSTLEAMTTRRGFSFYVVATQEGQPAASAVFEGLGQLAGAKVPPAAAQLAAYQASALAASAGAPAGSIAAVMQKTAAEYAGSAVVVRTARAIAPEKKDAPLQAVCKQTWYARAVRPAALYRLPVEAPLRAALLRSYDSTAYASRLDQAVRASVTGSHPLPAAELQAWSIATPADADAIAEVANATVQQEAHIGVRWTPQIVSLYLAASDLTFLVRRSGAAVTDVIALRMYAAAGATASAPVRVAALAAAFLPSMADKARRAATVAAVAGTTGNADVLLATPTFGFTATDLQAAFFDEVSGSREYVYVMAALDAVVPGLPATPSAQIFIPML